MLGGRALHPCGSHAARGGITALDFAAGLVAVGQRQGPALLFSDGNFGAVIELPLNGQLNEGASALAFSIKGDVLLLGSFAGGLYRLHFSATGTNLEDVPLTESQQNNTATPVPISCIVRQTERDIFAVAAGRCVFVLDAEGAVHTKIGPLPEPLMQLTWVDGSTLIGSTPNAINTWTLNGSQLGPVLRNLSPSPYLLFATSPDSRFLAVVCANKEVQCWELSSVLQSQATTVAEPIRLADYEEQVDCLDWDPDSRYLATSDGPDVTIWDMSEGSERCCKSGSIACCGHEHTTRVVRMAFQPGGHLLATASDSSKIVLYDVEQFWSGGVVGPAAAASLDIAGDEITALRWLPGSRLVAGTASGQVKIFQVEESPATTPLASHNITSSLPAGSTSPPAEAQQAPSAELDEGMEQLTLSAHQPRAVKTTRQTSIGSPPRPAFKPEQRMDSAMPAAAVPPLEYPTAGSPSLETPFAATSRPKHPQYNQQQYNQPPQPYYQPSRRAASLEPFPAAASRRRQVALPRAPSEGPYPGGDLRGPASGRGEQGGEYYPPGGAGNVRVGPPPLDHYQNGFRGAGPTSPPGHQGLRGPPPASRSGRGSGRVSPTSSLGLSSSLMQHIQAVRDNPPGRPDAQYAQQRRQALTGWGAGQPGGMAGMPWMMVMPAGGGTPGVPAGASVQLPAMAAYPASAVQAQQAYAHYHAAMMQRMAQGGQPMAPMQFVPGVLPGSPRAGQSASPSAGAAFMTGRSTLPPGMAPTAVLSPSGQWMPYMQQAGWGGPSSPVASFPAGYVAYPAGANSPVFMTAAMQTMSPLQQPPPASPSGGHASRRQPPRGQQQQQQQPSSLQHVPYAHTPSSSFAASRGSPTGRQGSSSSVSDTERGGSCPPGASTPLPDPVITGTAGIASPAGKPLPPSGDDGRGLVMEGAGSSSLERCCSGGLEGGGEMTRSPTAVAGEAMNGNSVAHTPGGSAGDVLSVQSTQRSSFEGALSPVHGRTSPCLALSSANSVPVPSPGGSSRGSRRRSGQLLRRESGEGEEGASAPGSPGSPREGVSTVYVGNLPAAVDEYALGCTFMHFGPVLHVQIIRDKVSLQSKGFGFVTFAHPAYATLAMQQMDQQVLFGPFGGMKIKVAPSRQGVPGSAQHAQRTHQHAQQEVELEQ